MSNKLQIYACSGLNGKDEQNGVYNYWLDNTKTVSNTQAANKLLALINLKYVQATYQRGLTPIQRAELLDEVDILTVCLYYANEYRSNADMLHHAGEVIGAMVDKGIFRMESVDSKQRDAHLDELLDKLAALMADDLQAPEDFMQWWKREIEDAQVVGMSVAEQQQITSALATAKPVSGADAQTVFDDPDIGGYLSKAGTYFLYTYFTDAQLKKVPYRNRRIFQRKAISQNNLKSYCAAVFIQKAYGDAAYLDTLIRTGIIKDFGKEPEDVCEDISNGGKPQGTGSIVLAGTMTIAELVTIIVAAISAVVAIITAICQAAAQVKIAKYESINVQSQLENTPNADDFEGIETPNSSASDGGLLATNPSLLIGGAVLLLLLLKD